MEVEFRSSMKVEIFIFDVISLREYYQRIAGAFPVKMSTHTVMFGLFLIVRNFKFFFKNFVQRTSKYCRNMVVWGLIFIGKTSGIYR